jgi:hypothetical protein
VPQFSKEAQAFLNAIIDNFCIDDAKEVKKIEKVTNHDVKAIEYFLKQRCSSNPEIAKVPTRIYLNVSRSNYFWLDFKLSGILNLFPGVGVLPFWLYL